MTQYTYAQAKAYLNKVNWEVLTNTGTNLTAFNNVLNVTFTGTTADFNALFEINLEAPTSEPLYDSANAFAKVVNNDASTLDFSNVPTADPEVAGALWIDAGVFTVSTGPA